MNSGIGEAGSTSDHAFTIDDDKLVMQLVAAGEAEGPMPFTCSGFEGIAQVCSGLSD